MTITGTILHESQGRHPIVRDGQIHGWVADPAHPGNPPLVELYIDGRLAGTTRADAVRTETSGREEVRGFSLLVPAAFHDDKTHDIEIAVDGQFGFAPLSSMRVVVDASGNAYEPQALAPRPPVVQAPPASKTSNEIKALLRASDWTAAEIALLDVLSARPSDQQARARLAYVLGKLEKFAEAALAYDALVHDYPDDANYRRGAAQCHRRLGNYVAVRDHLQHVLPAAPDDPQLRNWYADCLVQIHRDAGPEETAAALLEAHGRFGSGPEFLIRAADEFTQCDDTERAAKCYAEALAHGADADLVRRKVAAAHIQAFRLPEAEVLLSEARRFRDTAQAAVQHGRVLYRLGRLGAAQSAFSQAHELAPDDPSAIFGLAKVLAEQGALLKAADLLAPLVTAAAPKDWDAFFLASSIAADRGDISAALHGLRQSLARESHPAAAFLYGQLLADVRNFSVPHEHFTVPTVQGQLPEGGPSGIVAFVSVDDGYFRDHAVPMVFSIQRNSPGTALHIHVVNPGEDVEPTISHLRSLAPDVALSATFECVDFADKPIDFRRTYYASIRFLRAYQFMCVSPSACFILDADCIVRGSLLDLRHLGRDHDVLLHQRMQESIYLSLASGGVFIGDTQAARLYLKDAAEKIRRSLETGTASWFLDQMALSLALREPGAASLRVGQLPRSYIDWNFGDASVVWTGKGARKSLNAKYVNEYASYSSRLDSELSR